MPGIENECNRELSPLVTPSEVRNLYPLNESSQQTVEEGRDTMQSLVSMPNIANKLAVVTGPCSIHDPNAALEYAGWLGDMRSEFGDCLEIVMRCYVEKPRTTVGWKGLINDPYLNESYDINNGLKITRKLMADITGKGVPVGTEFLDPVITPRYIEDLISWGAIGARTVESPSHRQLASGLPLPVGFKNGTTGNKQVAVDAVNVAARMHTFTAITDAGKLARETTNGNQYCHVILRGGDEPNYRKADVTDAAERLKAAGRPQTVMIDASHANSRKVHTQQVEVVKNIARQISSGSTAIMGVMIESNLRPGAQKVTPGIKLEYGVSITDACVGLTDTREMFEILAEAVENRREFKH